MDFTKITGDNLFRPFLINSAYTLMNRQNEDVFFRTEVQADYLNNAYGIKENFIDTRMSADASIFLVDVGKEYNNENIIKRGKEYLNYFSNLKKRSYS
ncbi:hypothetical protein [Natranaerobius trueperi]|uniref:Uncharacterized protein n=1 Tax=Natranaerobius trueperi TaxID=759412 RepID=A0A226C0A8_9FIRM|nr:hypothetical protein [Natranaerobius trueperi]OWZ84625.1 hypothetical protein CDO51_02370 [Natranaerobius trueperi]